MLVGSSPTQWRPDLQRELEAAVHTEIGHNIKLDIQNQRTWIVLPNKKTSNSNPKSICQVTRSPNRIKRIEEHTKCEN